MRHAGRLIITVIATLTGFVAWCVAAATAAAALVPDPQEGPDPAVLAPEPAGTPLWQYLLLAAGALVLILVAAAVVVGRHSRAPGTSAAAHA